MGRLLKACGVAGVALFIPWLPYTVYFYHLTVWKIYGEEFYRARYGPSREPVIEVFGGKAFTRFSDIQPRLLDMDEAARRGDIVRRNWLGPAMLASDVFVDGMFALGLDYQNHTIFRPWMDSTLWGAHKKWSSAEIEEAAEKFLSGKKQLSLPKDFKEFGVRIIAESWLGLRVPEEFDAAEFIGSFQELRLNIGMIPEWMFQIPGMSYLSGWIQDRNAKYVKAISAALARYHPHTPPEHLMRFSANALDAMATAGGLSIGEIGARVVAAMWDKLGDLGAEGFQLNANNVENVILETVRLFPAVSNIAYERLRPFLNSDGTVASDILGREILAIGPVLHDPALWGPDAMEFRLRGQAAYEAERGFLAFGGHGNRSCPGTDLSIATLRALLLALEKRSWKLKGGGNVSFWGYATLPFTIEVQ